MVPNLIGIRDSTGSIEELATMSDFRTSFEIRNGWWIETKSTIPCILPKDGLIAVFLRKDIEEFMDSTYPTKGKGLNKRWYFNNTFDREIAEPDGDRVVCNPQVLQQHFMSRTLGESISLVNKPYHQRYWLPNRDYIYDMRIVNTPKGKVWRHSIVHNESQRVIDFALPDGRVSKYFDIALNHRMVEKLNLYAQELAERRYPRPFVRGRDGKKKKETIVYNVVNAADPAKPLMENVFFLHQAQQFKAVQVVKYPEQTFEILEVTRVP